MFTRVIVPLDGSEVAEAALRTAVELARLVQGPIHLLRVIDAHGVGSVAPTGVAFDYAMVAELVAEEETDAVRYMTDITRRLESDGLTATSAVPHGPVADRIINATTAGDVIVMASHGRTGLSRWFLGSVAEEVIRHARVPVLMIRHEEDNETRDTTGPDSGA